MALIGIAAAAKLCGKDRRTIERYLKVGTLSCTTDAAGKRVIDTSELMRVFGPLSHNVAHQNVAQNSDVPQQSVVHVAPSDDGEKVAMKAHIGTLERQLDARTQEVRELRAQVTGLLEWRRPDPVATPSSAPAPTLTPPELTPISASRPVTRRDIAVGAVAVGTMVAVAWSWANGYRLWFLL